MTSPPSSSKRSSAPTAAAASPISWRWASARRLTVLTEFRVLRMCGEVERLVVICPNSFKSGWADEIEKHRHRAQLPDLREPPQLRMSSSMTIDVLIMNYEAARTDKGKAAIIRFVAGHDCYLALDESVKLKNRNSKQTQAIIGKEHKLYPKPGITDLFKFVRLLSGKPMTQGPHDLWAQLTAIEATQGISYYGWQARFCQMGGWENKQVVGMLNEDLLQQIIAPVSFQAKKKDWLKGLPEKVYTTRRYELGPRSAEALRRDGGGLPHLHRGRARGGRCGDRQVGEDLTDPVRLRHQRRCESTGHCRAGAQPPAQAPAGDP